MVFLAAVFALVVGWAWWDTLRPAPAPAATSSTSAPVAIETTTLPPTAPVTDTAAPVTDTAAPSTGPGGVTKTAPGTATSAPVSEARKPEAFDREQDRAVLGDVIPRWATLDTSRGIGWARWEPNVIGPYVTPDFVDLSRSSMTGLWSGAARLGLSAEGATIESGTELWNSGPRSLWRISVARTMTPNDGGAGWSETVTWDFLIEHGEPRQVAAFLTPENANKDPDTFEVPRSTKP